MTKPNTKIVTRTLIGLWVMWAIGLTSQGGSLADISWIHAALFMVIGITLCLITHFTENRNQSK